MKDGKKLTASQRMLLKSDGVPNDQLGEWFYIKTVTESLDGGKRLTRDGEKNRFMIVKNTHTDEIRKVMI